MIKIGFKSLSFRIDEKLADDLKETAFRMKKSQSELVRRYIEDGLNSDKNQLKLEID